MHEDQEKGKGRELSTGGKGNQMISEFMYIN